MVTNMLSDDYIDVARLTARVEELEGERDSYEIDCPAGHNSATDTKCPECGGVWLVANTADSRAQWAQDAPEDAEELAAILAVLDDLRGYSGDHQWRGDWYPAALIADHVFEDYARELADDIGATPPDAGWPSMHIDWEAAAAALQQDYGAVEIDGVTYWYR